jgi:hypothetical protein
MDRFAERMDSAGQENWLTFEVIAWSFGETFATVRGAPQIAALFSLPPAQRHG